MSFILKFFHNIVTLGIWYKRGEEDNLLGISSKWCTSRSAKFWKKTPNRRRFLPQERCLGSLIKRSAMLDHSQSQSTTLDLTRPQSTMLDHGRLAFDTVVPIDRLFSLDLGQSVDGPWSTTVDLQRSIDRARSITVNQTVDHGRSIGAQLLEWPTLFTYLLVYLLVSRTQETIKVFTHTN